MGSEQADQAQVRGRTQSRRGVPPRHSSLTAQAEDATQGPRQTRLKSGQPTRAGAAERASEKERSHHEQRQVLRGGRQGQHRGAARAAGLARAGQSPAWGQSERNGESQLWHPWATEPAVPPRMTRKSDKNSVHRCPTRETKISLETIGPKSFLKKLLKHNRECAVR